MAKSNSISITDTYKNRHTGIATLPLHYGKAPRWLFERMARLARQIAIAVVEEYGSKELIIRLSDPYWFQALGCVLGFDWHSSGLTTTTCGALKEAVKGLEDELDIFIAGGKGGASRKTPSEIEAFLDKFSLKLDKDKLIYASRMSAKVDNTALQDGYQLYHHNFIFNKEGLWTVVQQGMDTINGWARRYHWLSTEVVDFVTEPEKAICCDHRHMVFNMVSKKSKAAQIYSCLLARQRPIKTIKEVTKLQRLKMPKEHTIFFNSLNPKSLKRVLVSTYESQPLDFERFLGIRGVGPKTLRAISLLSELIYKTNVDRHDPAKFSFAHGGKDGYPYRINKGDYDRSISILKNAVEEARLGWTERKDALKRLGSMFDI